MYIHIHIYIFMFIHVFTCIHIGEAFHTLHIIMCAISKIPESIGVLTNLKQLVMGSSPIVDLPPSIEALTTLHTIMLFTTMMSRRSVAEHFRHWHAHCQFFVGWRRCISQCVGIKKNWRLAPHSGHGPSPS